MNNILLTGGSGFVGRELSFLNNISLRHEVNESSLTSFRTVIYLAGLAHGNYKYNEYKSVNIDLVLNFVRLAVRSGIKRFVFLSSINVKDNFDDTLGLAAKSKWIVEKRLAELSDECGIEIVIVRAPLIYGANAPGNFGLLTKLINRLPFLPFGLAKNQRDFIAVQNLADLLITCANHPFAAGHTFLASDGKTVSIKEFTNAIAKGLGKTLIQIPVPISVMSLTARVLGKFSIAEQLFGDLQVDSSNTREILGWTPPYTMEQAMALLSENKK